MVIRGPKGERVVPAEEYWIGPGIDITRMNVLASNEILTAIRIPATMAGAQFYFEKVRDRHNLDESVKVLADGRHLLAQKDYDGALRAAYRAQTLHGSYYIWDLGDRPESLIADVETARAKPRKIETPPDVPVVKKDDKLPPPAPPAPAPAVRAPGRFRRP